MLRVGVKELCRLGINFENIVERGRAVGSEPDKGKEGYLDREGPISMAAPVARIRSKIAIVWGDGAIGIFGRTIRIVGCL